MITVIAGLGTVPRAVFPGTRKSIAAWCSRRAARPRPTKVAQLQTAVKSHAVIDQAIGVIAAVARMTRAQVWDLIPETSMFTNIRLRDVAELIVAWGTTGSLAADIREELSRRLNAIILR
ncbi:ANTAR domain-containing protein [Streptomyces sp. NPDC007148]|uniref:ANTAR domain-containing protein n=1 Tax=Streptomyces sp. NPDC007148 TaxID=3364775 RepID=UPI0036A10260